MRNAIHLGGNALVSLLNRSFQYGFELVNIEHVRYTQASCSRSFRGGTPLDVTIRDLNTGIACYLMEASDAK